MNSAWVEGFKELRLLLTQPRYSLAIWICGVCIIMAFHPSFVLLDDFRSGPAQQYTSLITLLAFMFWSVQVVFLFKDWLLRKWDDKIKREKVLKHLECLRPFEAAVLVGAVTEKAR